MIMMMILLIKFVYMISVQMKQDINIFIKNINIWTLNTVKM